MRAIIYLAVISTVLFTSCKSALFETEPANNPEAVFDQLWKTFDENYGGFAQRNIDWDLVYDEFRWQVTPATTDDELFSVFTAMLSVTDDGHVELTAPGRKEFKGSHFSRELIGYDLFDTDVITANYLEPGYSVGPEEDYLYGRIGEVAYLALPYVRDNMAIMDKVLDSNTDAKGLIIDLRHSNGGDFTWVFEYITRFYDKTRLVFTSRSRNGLDRDSFDGWSEWSISPDGEYWDKPVVLITDRFTISASERMALAYKVVPNTTFVGDTTNGSYATKVGKELQNGWYVGLPVQEVISADGTLYEGVGVPPDIHIVNTPERLEQGIDDVLNKALEQF